MFKSKLMKFAAIAAVLLAACSPVRAAEGDLREIKLGSGATQYQLLVNFPAAGTKCLRYMDGADGTTVGKALGCFKMGPQFVVDGAGFLTVPLTKGDAGPAGPQGTQGATGNTGSKGDNGSQGPIGDPGKTAYELASLSGYTGTLQSWLTSLQGGKGDPGQTGAKGDPGQPGAAGSQGAKGDPGTAGSQGATGATGSQGAKGDPGATGATGSQGAKGDPGKDGTQLLRIRATTASDGTYTWTFPTPFAAGTLPIISVSSEGSATVNYQHTITSLSASSVTVRVTPVTDVTLLGIHILGLQSAQAATIHLLAAPAP